MKALLKLILAMVTLGLIYGCGGGGDGINGLVANNNGNSNLPAGKATLTFSAMSTARMSAPISGIEFSFSLPQGMSVATTTGAGKSGQIESSSVTSGSGLTGSNIVFGSYSASTRRAYLGMATTGNSYRSGEILRLICTVGTNTAVSLDDLKTANNSLRIKKAVGYDANTVTTIPLTDKIRVTFGVLP